MLSMPTRPLSWKRAAAMIIIERLTAPASAIAITTSIRSKREDLAPLLSSRPTIRRCVSAECR